MGDPAGIGPEIAVKALLDQAVTSICRPVLIGDASVNLLGGDDGDDTLHGLAGDDTLMVIGGGEVYALALPLATTLHLTHVDVRVDGADAHFPAWEPGEWRAAVRECHPADERHAHAFEFVDYVRA